MKDKIIEGLSITLIVGFIGFLSDMAIRLSKAEGNIDKNKENVETNIDYIRADVKEIKSDIKELLKRK